MPMVELPTHQGRGISGLDPSIYGVAPESQGVQSYGPDGITTVAGLPIKNWGRGMAIGSNPAVADRDVPGSPSKDPEGERTSTVGVGGTPG